jgi:acetolactate synthase-1/2/3 large subunit
MTNSKHSGAIAQANVNSSDAIERPVASSDTGNWGSDVAADMLRSLDIPYIALNPGASYRGLHDSLVNRLGNRSPQMLLCLHEEHAVGIAHGWARVTNKPMMAMVHTNVGLMHASMALFNAWCDRVPLLLFGATGPFDAMKRRPWIDWIHTGKDLGALVRDFIKWDDQPASAGAIQESVLRARQIAETAPHGPTYVTFDVGLQEQKLDKVPRAPDPSKFRPPLPAAPSQAAAEEIARLLHGAQRPLILMGRFSRSEAGWQERIRFAEALGAVVLTDMKLAGAFPTSHPLHGAPAGARLSPHAVELLKQADVVLSLEARDLAGFLGSAWKNETPTAKIIRVGVDQHSHRGAGMEYMALPPSDLYVVAEPEPTVTALLAALDTLGPRQVPAWPGRKAHAAPKLPNPEGEGAIAVPHVAAALQQVTQGTDTCLVHPPLSWAGHLWPIEHPLDFIGGDTGGGLGGGPSQAVGAALALRGSGRLPISVNGDGDFMMGVTAIWTAVRYRIPLLMVVVNNHSYYNDELHQEHLAVARGRPPENRWIGQHMVGPELDLATIARGHGALGFGQVTKLTDLVKTLTEAVAAVKAGHVAIVDVRVEPGYQETGHTA